MATRRDWHDLPEGVRQAVEQRTGPVAGATSPAGGRNSELAVTLTTPSGPVFCKGITTGSPLAAMHRNELAIGPHLPADLAPRLLWHVEQDDWLLLGFEHAAGHHADLSPDSDDLPAVADAVTRIRLTAPPTTQRPMASQWAQALKTALATPSNSDLITDWAAKAPDHMHGGHLIHSDLNPANFLITDTAKVIDWAWWRTGAAWIDPALLVIRLIAAGHQPDAAEHWATRHSPDFATTPPDALTAFAASVVRIWERRFPSTPTTTAARTWTRHRTSCHQN
ncbi:phosphotransferase [Saccharothrix obliqua]|uniref:phosphotransferase n=1 Tax=Saccharothrix obliqua TaxID=2861747 RepID=UPI001C600EC2|nr:hypothetical protein [Saccharothrix obliqua]MBW4721055.1 phosphotransferase [Saccharothrix obliqua]